MLLEKQIQSLKQAVQGALQCEAATQLPAELTVAQWALETGWGVHQPANNCFGIKAYSGCYGVQTLSTVEVIHGVSSNVEKAFATFPSLNACFQKHSEIITRELSYRKAWQQYLASRDWRTLVRQIAPIYATGPTYAERLLEIVNMNEVKSALAEERRLPEAA
jgi:flagellar protein FlgJ